MRLILNGINGRYLRDITASAAGETESVEAAVAYVNDETLLFEWCWDNNIPLRFWGRFDDSIPVRVDILRSFLDRRSERFACKLLRRFHAKLIWWHGVGAYVGSANLNDAAWHGNVEAGCYFDEAEMAASGMDVQIREFFRRVDEVASPLTDELYRAIRQRAAELQQRYAQDEEQRRSFLATPSVRAWPGLVTVARGTASEGQKRAFIKEWFDTLQILRNIGAKVSSDEFRPRWIPPDAPTGSQADQFLHAYYYNHVIGEGGRSFYEEKFEANKDDPERALAETMAWWRDLPESPGSEARMLFEWAPLLRRELALDRILDLTEREFNEICHRVWSIQDHARRVANATLNLPGGRRYSMDEKTDALAHYLYRRQSQNGSSVLTVIRHVLYDGVDEEAPLRLWDATANDAWRIDHLGLSALGELIGWALPDKFPPRNNRTSKALYALGFPVSVYGS